MKRPRAPGDTKNHQVFGDQDRYTGTPLRVSSAGTSLTQLGSKIRSRIRRSALVTFTEPALSIYKSLFVLFLQIFVSISYADTVYVVGQGSNNVYSIDLLTGEASVIASIDGNPGLTGIALLDNTTAYVVGEYNNGVYSVNLLNGESSLVTTIPGDPSPQTIVLASPTTAYTVGILTNTVYSIDLTTGTSSPVATIDGNPGLYALALSNATTAYTLGVKSNAVYSVDLKSGKSSILTTLDGTPGPSGISLKNSTTAYVVCGNDNSDNVYSIDLSTGESSIVATLPENLDNDGMALENTTTECVVSFLGNVSLVDLSTGESFLVTTIPGDPGLKAIAFPIRSIVCKPGGNDGRLANYLNSLAMMPGIAPIMLTLYNLPCDTVKAALTSISPARNAFMTFSAGNTMFVFSEMLHNRIQFYRKNSSTAFLAALSNNDALITANTLPRGSAQRAAAKKENWAVWAEGLGEFAYQHAESQNPSFNTATGGVLGGFDYYGNYGQISSAFGFAHSYLKADEDLGNDKIDFYTLGLYGIGYIEKWYIEVGAWGVYNQYEGDRHVFFSGFDAHAKSRHNGWQAVPHFEIGYDAKIGSWVLEPFTRADCAIIWQDGFSEYGADPLNMNQKSSTSEFFQAKSGLNLYTTRNRDWGLWILRGQLAYIYKKGFGIGKIADVAIVDQPAGFTVNSFKGAQNLFSPGFEFFIRGKNGVFGSMNYDGQFGSSYMSNTVFAKLGFFF